MICIEKLTTTRGRTYYNLYYPTNWEELKDVVDNYLGTALFYYRTGNSFSELEIETDKIKEIYLGKDNPTTSNFYLYYNEELDKYLLTYDDTCESYAGDADLICHPRLKEIYGFCEEFFEKAISDYELPDHDDIIDLMIGITIGYMETTLELDNEKLSNDMIYIQGYIVAIMLAIFICSKLEADPLDKTLRRDVNKIVPEFSAFMTENQDNVKVLDKEEFEKLKDKS